MTEPLSSRREIDRCLAGDEEIGAAQTRAHRLDVLDQGCKKSRGALRPVEPEGFSNPFRLRRQREEHDRRARPPHDATLPDYTAGGCESFHRICSHLLVMHLYV